MWKCKGCAYCSQKLYLNMFSLALMSIIFLEAFLVDPIEMNEEESPYQFWKDVVNVQYECFLIAIESAATNGGYEKEDAIKMKNLFCECLDEKIDFHYPNDYLVKRRKEIVRTI